MTSARLRSGATQCVWANLALDAVLVQVGVEVLVCEMPTRFGGEDRAARPLLDLCDRKLRCLLLDALVGAFLFGISDLLPTLVFGDVGRRPRVDEGVISRYVLMFGLDIDPHLFMNVINATRLELGVDGEIESNLVRAAQRIKGEGLPVDRAGNVEDPVPPENSIN